MLHFQLHQNYFFCLSYSSGGTSISVLSISCIFCLNIVCIHSLYTTLHKKIKFSIKDFFIFCAVPNLVEIPHGTVQPIPTSLHSIGTTGAKTRDIALIEESKSACSSEDKFNQFIIYFLYQICLQVVGDILACDNSDGSN